MLCERKDTSEQIHGIAAAGPGGEDAQRLHLAGNFSLCDTKTHLWGLERGPLSFPLGLDFSH